MAKYRKISPSIWNDSKFRSLSDNGKLVFFMLLTHPQTSAIGTIRAYQQGLAPEMGWQEKAFGKAFREVLEKGMAIYSERDGLIWLPNFMKYNAPENPNVLKSWAAGLDDCPECALKNKVYEQVKAFAEGLSEAFSKAFREAFKVPLPKQEQEQEQEQEQNKRGGKPALPNCPHEEIIQAYHEQLPTLPRVKVWNEDRESNLRARWRERCAQGKYSTTEEGLAYWTRLFKHVNDCPWLMGQITPRDGKPFFADLAWLVKPENFAKLIEGKYDRRADQ